MADIKDIAAPINSLRDGARDLLGKALSKKREVYRLTPSSPDVLSPATISSLTPQTVLLVEDFTGLERLGEGEREAAQRDGYQAKFRLEGAVAKIVIFNSRNFSLSIHAPSKIITSTLELHHSSHISINLDPSLLTASTSSETTHSGPLSRLPVLPSPPINLFQLDPALTHVQIHFGHPALFAGLPGTASKPSTQASLVLCPKLGYVSDLKPKIGDEGDSNNIELESQEGARVESSGFEDLIVSYDLDHGNWDDAASLEQEPALSTKLPLTTPSGSLHPSLVSVLISTGEGRILQAAQAGSALGTLSEGQYMVRLMRQTGIAEGAQSYRWMIEHLRREENEYPALNR